MTSKSKKKQRSISGRYILIVCIFVAWMGILIWRLSYLQIARHDELREKARIQQGGVEAIKAFRGEIVDRHGKLLAGSIDADSVMADLHQIQEKSKATIIKALAPLLRASEEDLQRKFNSGNQAPIIAKKLDAEASNNIRTTIETNKFTGVKIIRETQRLYPNGMLAAHLLGFVNGAAQGVSGLEMRLNNYLGGQDGKLLFEKDALGRPFSRLDKESLAGARVITTIDAVMQHKVEEALAQALAETRAESASAIVMDPKTGEILALANAPTFDPAAKFSGSENESYIRRNRAITDVYEPGSVFKLVTYSAAIEEGLARPDEKINCRGPFMNGPHAIQDTHPYGELTVAQALAKSSNVGAIKIALRVGKERFADYISRFGFGSKTEIDLPAEENGLVSPVKQWSATALPSMAIGYGVGVTAIQAVSAMAAIANHGTWIQPHIIRKIVRGDSGQYLLLETKPKMRRVVSEQTADTIKSMLAGVVETGTARHAVQLAGYTAAGKTGTAKKVIGGKYSESAYFASFAGFVPATTPRFAIIVVLDNPKGAHQGGQVAAPVFNQIAQAALSDYGVLPDTDDHRQAMLELQEKFGATPKDWNKEPVLPTPIKVAAASPPLLKSNLKATSAPTPQIAKIVPTPKPTPILKLPTPKEQNKMGTVAIKSLVFVVAMGLWSCRWHSPKPQAQKPILSKFNNQYISHPTLASRNA